MYLGKLGPRDEVHERPLHPYTRGLVQAVPVPDPAVERTKRSIAVGGDRDRTTNRPGLPVSYPLSVGRTDLRRTRATAPVHPDGRHSVACHFPLGDVWTAHAETRRLLLSASAVRV
jgi:ABC-type dipeptide/oligopeptide/nickel transport system ATPase component